jgi:hypothetical protein
MVGAVPSWFTQDMSKEDISAHMGLAPTQELQTLSPELAAAMKKGRGEVPQAWWTQPPSETTSTGTKRSSSSKKTTSSRRSTYSSSRSSSYKKSAAKAQAAGPMDWAELKKVGGNLIIEELVKSWMGKEQMTPEGEEYLRALHEQKAIPMPLEQWIEGLREQWAGVKYSFRERETEKYGETLTWSDFKDRASPFLIEELDSYFAGEMALSPEGWEYFTQLAATYAGDLAPVEWLSQLFRNWQRSMKYWGRDERIRRSSEMSPEMEAMMRYVSEVPTVTQEGDWTWIDFADGISTKTRALLREAGAKESRTRKMWYFKESLTEQQIMELLRYQASTVAPALT